MFIDLNDIMKNTTFFGKTSLIKLENKLKELRKYNETKTITIDVSTPSLSIRPEFLIEFARLSEYYNCEFIGLLDDKNDIIDSYINTGYFIKSSLGAKAYSELLKELITTLDFPLMILDNRLDKYNFIDYNIIQPIGFSKYKFYYKKLKPSLLEPRILEKACWENKEEIWSQEEIFISEMSDSNIGFRFAKSIKEKTILELYKKILDGSYYNF